VTETISATPSTSPEGHTVSQEILNQAYSANTQDAATSAQVSIGTNEEEHLYGLSASTVYTHAETSTIPIALKGTSTSFRMPVLSSQKHDFSTPIITRNAIVVLFLQLL
jgi:hypothetical protein